MAGVSDGDVVEQGPGVLQMALDRERMGAAARHDAVAKVTGRRAGMARGQVELLGETVQVGCGRRWVGHGSLLGSGVATFGRPGASTQPYGGSESGPQALNTKR